jgi:hypothetical protein
VQQCDGAIINGVRRTSVASSTRGSGRGGHGGAGRWEAAELTRALASCRSTDAVVGRAAEERGQLLLPFPALGGGHPSALDMGWAAEPTAAAAGAAPHVGAVLLGVVAAVLAARPGPAAAGACASRAANPACSVMRGEPQHHARGHATTGEELRRVRRGRGRRLLVRVP